MINVIICGQSSFSISILTTESIYNLKERIEIFTGLEKDKQRLDYAGKCLTSNDITLWEAGIENNSTVHLCENLEGGSSDSLTIIMWITYIILLLYFFLIMFSGLVPVFAHLMGFLLEKGIHWISGNFLKDSKIFKIIMDIIQIVIKIGIVYLFTWAYSTFFVYPLAYLKTQDSCISLSAAQQIGYYVALVFIIIYIIFNTPDFLIAVSSKVASKIAYMSPFTKFLFRILKNASDWFKWAGLYAIPFVGTPFLEGYQMAVSIASTGAVDGSNLIDQQFSCDRPEEISTIFECILKFTKSSGESAKMSDHPECKQNMMIYDEFAEYVKNNNLQEMIEIADIYFNTAKKTWYKLKVEQMTFWQKLSPFNSIAAHYYMSESIGKGFCYTLDIIKGINEFLGTEIGGSAALANMIDTGNIAGVGGILTFLICLIIMLFGGFGTNKASS